MTHRCNLRCHMCDLFGRGEEIDSIRSRREGAEGSFSMELLERLCNSFGCMKPVLSFGGGEPLLHPAIAAMVSRAKERGFTCTLTTNGTLLAAHAASLVEAGLDSLVLSIDGPEEIHDATRGVKGTFAKACEGAAALAEARARFRSRTPRMRINCTINSRNAGMLGEVVRIAERLGAESMVFSHLWFWDRTAVEEHNRLYGDLCPTVEQNTRELDRIDPVG
ncbi:MAG: radical SAM protein, partial [Candidatus Aureabacteria bacterium]|nr:radical SAM protein [Candidatus Auribacterota bacterium]